MTTSELLDRLNKLLPAQFAELVFRLGVPAQYLSQGPQATVAIEVIRYVTQINRLADLESLLVASGSASSSAPTGHDVRSGGPFRPPGPPPDWGPPGDRWGTGGGGGGQRPGAPIKVLFLAAEPTDGARLQIGKEVREIGHKVREANAGAEVELVEERAVRATDLQGALLRHRPDIVHFSGHGSKTGQLVFEDEYGGGKPAPIAAIGTLFSVLNKTVRCVVLNACFSVPQADVLRQHIDCVIGISGAIFEPAPVFFATSFYVALGHDESVAAAFALGKVQIALAGVSGDDLPVLVPRDGVDPAAVRLARRRQARP